MEVITEKVVVDWGPKESVCSLCPLVVWGGKEDCILT